MRQPPPPAAALEPGPPDPTREAPTPADEGLLRDLEALLHERYGATLVPDEQISVSARTGASAAWLRARVGDAERALEFELFTRLGEPASSSEDDDLLAWLIDFLDGVLAEFFAADRDAYLPLDFTPHAFEGRWIFARSELRDFAAEAAANAWLERAGLKGQVPEH